MRLGGEPMADKKLTDEQISLLMAEWGRKGGKAGTGKAKVRGGSDYYKRIRKGLKGKAKKAKEKT